MSANNRHLFPSEPSNHAEHSSFFAVSLAIIFVAVAGVAYGDNDRSGPPHAIFKWAGEVEGRAGDRPFTTDGSLMLTRGTSVFVWNCQTLKLAGLAPHQNDVIAWGLIDDKTVFTAGKTEVRFWNISTSRIELTQKVLAEGGMSDIFAINSAGSLFVFTAFPDFKAAVVWKAGGLRPIGRLPNMSAVSLSDFDISGKKIVTREFRKGEDASNDGSLFHVWDAQTCIENFPAIASTYYFNGHVQAADFDPSGKSLVIAQRNGFTIIDALTGKTLAETEWPGQLMTNTVFFSPDGKHIILTTLDGIDPGPVKIFDRSSTKLVRSIDEHIFAGCAISADGTWLLGYVMSSGPELWNITDGKKLQSFPGIKCISMSINADKSILVFGGKNTQVYRIRK